MEITLEDVKKFFADNVENDDVKAYLVELTPPAEPKPLAQDDVKTYLETSEGRLFIQPMMDKRVTEAIDTYRKKTLEPEINARVAAEMLKRNPEETPADRRIRELEERNKRNDEEREIEKKLNSIKELAFKEGIDPDFISGISFDSVEAAALYMRRFKQKLADVEKNKANELFALGGFKPGAGNPKEGSTKKDYANMSLKEAIALEEAGEFDK